MKMKHQEDISCIPDDCFTEITRHSPISRKYGQPHKVSVSIPKWEAPQQTMKTLRRLLGFSITEMAKHFNVSPGTYHAYETGKYKAPDHVIHYFWLLHNTVNVLYDDLRNLAANNATSYRSFEAFQKAFKDKNPTYLDYRIREAAIALASIHGECEVEIVDIYKGD